MIVDYNTPCLECAKTGQTGTLQYDTDTAKVRCNGETVHEFAEMPGESSPAAEGETVGSSSRSPESETVPEEPMSQEDEAALDEAMAKDPRPRDFGNQITGEDPEVTAAEIAPPEPSGTQGEVLPGEVLTGHCGMPALIGGMVEAFANSPRLGLGEFVVMPNGDAAICCSIDEKWVTGMQSEAEVQGKTFTEYFQELLNDSLLQWYSSVPGVR